MCWGWQYTKVCPLVRRRWPRQSRILFTQFLCLTDRSSPPERDTMETIADTLLETTQPAMGAPRCGWVNDLAPTAPLQAAAYQQRCALAVTMQHSALAWPLWRYPLGDRGPRCGWIRPVGNPHCFPWPGWPERGGGNPILDPIPLLSLSSRDGVVNTPCVADPHRGLECGRTLPGVDTHSSVVVCVCSCVVS